MRNYHSSCQVCRRQGGAGTLSSEPNHLLALLTGRLIAAGGPHRTFFIPKSKPHYAPDRPIRIEHLRLDVEVFPEQTLLRGTATQRFKIITPGQKTLILDQEGLTIRQVRFNGLEVPFQVKAGKLEIPFPETARFSPDPGSVFEITVAYEVFKPSRGIYFTGPDASRPHRPYQVWTQGQDEDSRHWYPTLDYPNQKFSSEVIATVPRKYTVVSNGGLLSREPATLVPPPLAPSAGTAPAPIPAERFHFRLDSPHVNYLVTLIVAELTEIRAEAQVAPDRPPVPVQYFVTPGREDEARRSFGQTPRMMEVFSKITGMPYAYEKYAQTAVQDFVMGGMENTTATTQTDLTLHDARAALDFSSDPLVSHELAHQWFGNLLTCRDWSHAWLNEGFATFFERVWIENDPRPDRGGADEAAYYGYQQQLAYIDEDENSYRRPLVSNHYIEPMDLFDRHLYEKGGAVLNLLRAQLGTELFWKSIALYVSRHRGQNVETLDLIRAIEDATGLNQRRFFDQWVYSGGYPDLAVRGEWHETDRRFELEVTQKQTGGENQPVYKNGVATPVFELALPIQFGTSRQGPVAKVAHLTAAHQTFSFSLDEKPEWCAIDPGSTIPKRLSLELPAEMLIAALKLAPDALSRIQAAQALGKAKYHRDILPALAHALANDPFWGVRAEVAEVLGQHRSNDARDALIAGLAAAKHPKARRAIATACGHYRGAEVQSALHPLADSDPSYFVEARATLALARALETPYGAAVRDTQSLTEFLLKTQISKPSYRDVIAADTLRAVTEVLMHEPGGPLVWTEGLHILFASAHVGPPPHGHSLDRRVAAIQSLAKIGLVSDSSLRRRILAHFDQLAEEPNFRIRLALIDALVELQDPAGVSLLKKMEQLDIDPRVRRDCQVAVEELSATSQPGQSYLLLSRRIATLEAQLQEIRTGIERKSIS